MVATPTETSKATPPVPGAGRTSVPVLTTKSVCRPNSQSTAAPLRRLRLPVSLGQMLRHRSALSLPTSKMTLVKGTEGLIGGPAALGDHSGLTLPPDPYGPDAWRAIWKHPDARIGNIYLPKSLTLGKSYPGRPGLVYRVGEVGIIVTTHKRPRYDDDGCLVGYDLIGFSVSHNERVDRGAVRQDLAVFASTAATMTAVAVANAALTKTKTDEALGIITSGSTNFEFTTVGLSRAAGSLGTYTAPSAIGLVFSRIISAVFTASGAGGTAKGSGLFNSTTPAGSFLYVEDNHTDAVLVAADQLTEQWTISN